MVVTPSLPEAIGALKDTYCSYCSSSHSLLQAVPKTMTANKLK
jgi:hypothetical protein